MLKNYKNILSLTSEDVFDFFMKADQFYGGELPKYFDIDSVLAYVRESNGDKKIIRYRNDYRMFCNDKNTLERISYILQHVLENLNFRMNSQKTKISDTIVIDSIKADKLFYIYNTPIFNKKGVDFDSFEKHLLYILMYGRQFLLREYKNQNLRELPESVIISLTKVKMNIGEKLKQMMSNILDADKMPDDSQIKISDYRSNMSAKVFEQGESFQVLLNKIEAVVKNSISAI